MDMGAYVRKHSRHDRSTECEADRALSVLRDIRQLCRTGKIFRICATGTVEVQTAQRPVLLADMEEIQRNIEDTSSGDTKDISDKCLLGEWLIEEPYALIGHVRFCEGLLRLEPLIAKEYR